MSDPAVHWHEGMFLKPHHFQAAARHAAQLGGLGDKLDLHYNWGLRSIELDEAAVANNRLVITGLKARLRDGTLVSIPEDGSLAAADLKKAFEEKPSLDVYLGVPVFQPKRANIATAGEHDGARYAVETVPITDENTGQDDQPLEVRRLNFRVLLSTDDLTGFETIPIARIEKLSAAEAVPRLDVTYIPPVLACDGWKALQHGILRNTYERIGTKIELLVSQAQARRIAVDSLSPGDALIIAQLRELNEAYALLGVLIAAEGVHPFPAYVELCRLVGQLSVFGAAYRPPELPAYNHDDLGGCFGRVKQYIDALLYDIVEPAYKVAPFVGAGLRMQVSLQPEWLETAWQMFIGVHSPRLSADECVRLLTRTGLLDMKIGSADRVEEIFKRGMGGLKFEYKAGPPGVLPSGRTYFQINRDSQHQEWEDVRKSLTLAIRLKERDIQGSIQGQQELRIAVAGQTHTMQFHLYVLRREQK
jgi:type VI secretion system protein ImpJ